MIPKPILIMALLVVLPLASSQVVQINPWDAVNPLKQNITISEYLPPCKSCNAAFFNNVGNYTVLAQQVHNITAISFQLSEQSCNFFRFFMQFSIPSVILVFFLALLVLKGDFNNWVHLVEFCQEVFLLLHLNVVREPCLLEYLLAFKTTFFVSRARINLMRNTNYLRRLFYQSCFFLENIAEISFVSCLIFLVYLLVITIHLFTSSGSKNDSGLKKLLANFEFGLFIRLGQLIVTPFAFYAFLGMRVVVFDTNTRIFDFIIACLYSILMLGFVAFSIYIVNYAPINMEDRKVVKKFGAFYDHVKYKREQKHVCNEFFFRQLLKSTMAALHALAYFQPFGVAMSGALLYFVFTVYVLLSLWRNGMYDNLFNTFKMAIFHTVMCANYIFVLIQIDNKELELYIASFFVQLMNSLMIILLLIYLVFAIIDQVRRMKNQSRVVEYDPDLNDIDLNVALYKVAFHEHGDLQERRPAGQRGRQ